MRSRCAFRPRMKRLVDDIARDPTWSRAFSKASFRPRSRRARCSGSSSSRRATARSRSRAPAPTSHASASTSRRRSTRSPFRSTTIPSRLPASRRRPEGGALSRGIDVAKAVTVKAPTARTPRARMTGTSAWKPRRKPLPKPHPPRKPRQRKARQRRRSLQRCRQNRRPRSRGARVCAHLPPAPSNPWRPDV